MAIKHGTADGQRYLGSTRINRVYLGSTRVYGDAPAGGGGGGYSWTRYATVTDDNANAATQITLSFNTDGTVSYTNSTGDSVSTDLTHWHDGGTVSGIGNSRWAKKTSTGDATSGTLTSSLVAMSSARTISIQSVAGEARAGQELIEIYSDSGGTTKVGQIDLAITASI